MEEINIVGACDEKFLQHFGVMISSLLRSNSGSRFRIFLITTAPENTLAGVRGMVETHGSRFDVLRITPNSFGNLPSISHLSQAAYFRLAIPFVMPADVSRAIYLDCDIVVTKSIVDLWKVDLEGLTVGAVPEAESSYNLKKLGLPAGSLYFNSGVMLIDVDKWRSEKISDAALRILTHEFDRITWADQCALNIALNRRWKGIERKWNLITQFLGKMEDSDIFLYPGAKEMLENSAIIHFSTHSKPWHYANQHPAKHLYWSEIKHTPWKNAKPTGLAGYLARKILRPKSRLIALYERLAKAR